MRCHYCDAEAAYAADSDGVRVGLCKTHLQEWVSTYAASDLDAALEELRT